MFWPQFTLRFNEKEQPILAAKKTSSQPSASYVFSTTSSNFEENSDHYLGKMESNIFGNTINLYGAGLDPSDAQSMSKIPRQLFATIVYLKSVGNGPRQFEVYVKKPEYRYYLNFSQVIMYGEEIPLSELYKDNREKIERYVNRKATFNRDKQVYTLNFKGKAECSSIKNFILEDEYGKDILMFGKINESTFNIEISCPLSALVGFAIALTSFDSKILFGS